MKLIRGYVPEGQQGTTLLEAVNIINEYGVHIPMDAEHRKIFNENKGVIEKELENIQAFAKSKMIDVPEEYSNDLKAFRDAHAFRNNDVMASIEKMHEMMKDMEEGSPEYNGFLQRLRELEHNMFLPAMKNGQPIPDSFQYDDKNEDVCSEYAALMEKHKDYLAEIAKAQTELKEYMMCEIKIDFKKVPKENLPKTYPPLIYVNDKWINSDMLVNHPVIQKIFHYSFVQPVMGGVNGGAILDLQGNKI